MKMCGGCHLWKERWDFPGEIGKRGGGCSDCHIKESILEKIWLLIKIRKDILNTISPFGKNCETCHLNPVAAGLGIFKENSINTELTIPASPCLPKMRLLTKEEQKKC